MNRIKIVAAFFVTLLIGVAIGFSWKESRLEPLNKHITELNEVDIEEFLRLKSQEEKYKKADEILGKAILIFLEDLRLRVSDKALMFAKKATAKPELEPIPLPTKVQELDKNSGISPNEGTLQELNSQRGSELQASEESALPDKKGSTGTISTGNSGPGIYGSVKFLGTIPPRLPSKMNTDLFCRKLNGGQPAYHSDGRVGVNGSLASVFVYIKSGVNSDTVYPVPLEPVVIKQRGCRYYPHVMGLRAGQTLRIVNEDPTLHNIHSLATMNANFNMGMATVGQMADKRFTNPEVMIRLKCDVHSWMDAYVGVLSHPYFAVTNNEGNFTIPNLPQGDYVLEAWHETYGTKILNLTLTSDPKSQKLNFTFKKEAK